MARTRPKRGRTARPTIPVVLQALPRPQHTLSPPVTVIGELLERAASLEPLAQAKPSQDERDPSVAEDDDTTEEKKPAAKRPKVSSSNSISSKVTDAGDACSSDYYETVLMGDLGSDNIASFLDVQSVSCCRRTSRGLRESWRPALECAVVRYFVLTTETREAAEHCCQGGWTAFVDFLAGVAIMVQREFDALGLRPPLLYRALLAQQSIRACDGSPVPIFFGAVREWHYKDGGVTKKKVRPTLRRCLGYDLRGWSDEEVDDHGDESLEEDECRIDEHSQYIDDPLDLHMVLPSYKHIPRISQSPETMERLETFMEYLSGSSAKAGSVQQSRARRGELPCIFLAQCGTDSYAAWWALTVDGNNNPHLVWFRDYLSSPEGANPFESLKNGLDDVNSLFFSSSTDGVWDWDLREAGSRWLLLWSAFCKAIGVAPFDKEFDVEEVRGAIKAHEREGQSYPSIDQEEERILSYFSSLCLLPGAA